MQDVYVEFPEEVDLLQQLDEINCNLPVVCHKHIPRKKENRLQKCLGTRFLTSVKGTWDASPPNSKRSKMKVEDEIPETTQWILTLVLTGFFGRRAHKSQRIPFRK